MHISELQAHFQLHFDKFKQLHDNRNSINHSRAVDEGEKEIFNNWLQQFRQLFNGIFMRFFGVQFY